MRVGVVAVVLVVSAKRVESELTLLRASASQNYLSADDVLVDCDASGTFGVRPFVCGLKARRIEVVSRLKAWAHRPDLRTRVGPSRRRAIPRFWPDVDRRDEELR